MIDVKLKVEPYCHDCPYFSYEVSHNAYANKTDSNVTSHYVSVKCENRQLCLRLKGYLEGQIKC